MKNLKERIRNFRIANTINSSVKRKGFKTRCIALMALGAILATNLVPGIYAQADTYANAEIKYEEKIILDFSADAKVFSSLDEILKCEKISLENHPDYFEKAAYGNNYFIRTYRLPLDSKPRVWIVPEEQIEGAYAKSKGQQLLKVVELYRYGVHVGYRLEWNRFGEDYLTGLDESYISLGSKTANMKEQYFIELDDYYEGYTPFADIKESLTKLGFYGGSSSSGNQNSGNKIKEEKVVLDLSEDRKSFESIDELLSSEKISPELTPNYFKYSNDYLDIYYTKHYELPFDSIPRVWIIPENQGCEIDRSTKYLGYQLDRVSELYSYGILVGYELTFRRYWDNIKLLPEVVFTTEEDKKYYMSSDNPDEGYVPFATIKEKLTKLGVYDQSSSIDNLYKNAYQATQKALTEKTQASVNEARTAIKALPTKFHWAIGEFSKQVDTVQHPILVNIVNSIKTAEKTPNQTNINAAKKAIPAELTPQWKNSYSSAVDKIQVGLQAKALDLVKIAESSKTSTSVNNARVVVNDIMTADSIGIRDWAKVLSKRLDAIKI